MKRNCHDAKPPNEPFHIVDQMETDAAEEYGIIKCKCLSAVGKQG